MNKRNLAIFFTSMVLTFVVSSKVIDFVMTPSYEAKIVKVGGNQHGFAYSREGGIDLEYRDSALKAANEKRVVEINAEARLEKVPSSAMFVIPQAKRRIGWGFGSYEWIELVHVDLVSFQPQTAHYANGKNVGTSSLDQAFVFETSNSINFMLAGTIRISVARDDTARFQSTFAGAELKELLDDVVWGMAQVRGFNFFAQYQDDQLNEIYPATLGTDNEMTIKDFGAFLVFEALRDGFSRFGIVVEEFSYAGGVIFVNKNIQSEKDKIFNARRQIDVAYNELRSNIVDNRIRIEQEETARDNALLLWRNRQGILLETNLEVARRLTAAKAEMIRQWTENGSGVVPRTVSSDDYFKFLEPAAPEQLTVLQGLTELNNPELDKLAEEVTERRKAEAAKLEAEQAEAEAKKAEEEQAARERAAEAAQDEDSDVQSDASDN